MDKQATFQLETLFTLIYEQHPRLNTIQFYSVSVKVQLNWSSQTLQYSLQFKGYG